MGISGAHYFFPGYFTQTLRDSKDDIHGDMASSDFRPWSLTHSALLTIAAIVGTVSAKPLLAQRLPADILEFLLPLIIYGPPVVLAISFTDKVMEGIRVQGAYQAAHAGRPDADMVPFESLLAGLDTTVFALVHDVTMLVVLARRFFWLRRVSWIADVALSVLTLLCFVAFRSLVCTGHCSEAAMRKARPGQEHKMAFCADSVVEAKQWCCEKLPAVGAVLVALKWLTYPPIIRPPLQAYMGPDQTCRPNRFASFLDRCPENPYLEDIIRALEKEKRSMRKLNDVSRAEATSSQQKLDSLFQEFYRVGQQNQRRGEMIAELQRDNAAFKGANEKYRKAYDNLDRQCQKVYQEKLNLEVIHKTLKDEHAVLKLKHDTLKKYVKEGWAAGEALEVKVAHYQKTADKQTQKAQTATARADDLQKRLEAKQDLLTGTKGQLDKATEYLVTMNKLVDERDGEIDDLRTFLTDQSEELRNERDTLKTTKEHYEAKLEAERIAAIDEFDRRTEEALIVVIEYEAQIQDRERIIKGHQRTLFQLEQAFSELDSTLDIKNEKIEEKIIQQKTTISCLEKDVDDLERLAKGLFDQIKRLEHRNKYVEAGIRPKDAAIAMYERDLHKAWHQLADKKSQLSESAEKLRVAEGRLIQQDIEIEKLQEVVKTLDIAVANGDVPALVDAKDAGEAVDDREVEGVEDEIDVETLVDDSVEVDVADWEEVDETAGEDEESLGGEEWDTRL